MNNATLVYKIDYNKQLRLENRSLYLIDKITSSFKNDEDFIKHYYNKEEIYKFIKENGNQKGNLVIDYKKDQNIKEELKPLYNIKEGIVIDEDFYNNQITEIEKARKLLFNSKNQIFTRLLLSNKTLEFAFNKYIDLDIEEVKFCRNNNIKLKNVNDKFYVSFKSLLEYRVNSPKLGMIRNAYLDMLNILKNRIMQLDRNTFYFYNRELRLLIEKYKEMINIMTIKNIVVNPKIKKSCKYVINRD